MIDYKPHFMIIPSLSCPANCTYCFGPRQGPVMSLQKMTQTIEFIGGIAKETNQSKIRITFHGGEPLMAGHTLLRHALEGLTNRYGRSSVTLAIQSNLWLLDEEYCRLFKQYNVEIGSSLDGPEHITDAQRGSGYFAKTMQGITLARSFGLNVSCIATFTPSSLNHWQEVVDFFIRQRLGMSIHAAVPSMEGDSSQPALTPHQYKFLLSELLDYYIRHRREITITSLDQACKGAFLGTGQMCTFRDCLGDFLVIDPAGDIFPCQRLAGTVRFCLGNISTYPGVTELFNSPAAQPMKVREKQIKQECASCPHMLYCKGGCPYNAWAGDTKDSAKDPYCSAYYRLFDSVWNRLQNEMETEENINAVAQEPDFNGSHGLFRKGELIELVREGLHPSQKTRSARRVIAAVELAKGPDIPTAASRLVQMGIARNRQSAEASLLNLQHSLQPGSTSLNRLYIHVTFKCQLNCTHCYANAGTPDQSTGDMPVDEVINLIRQAKQLGFAQVTITGGEPLLHSQRDRLLTELKAARQWASPMRLSLRTNLAFSLTNDEIKQIGAAADQIVVSLDGDQHTHEARRGQGTFNLTVKNLELLSNLSSKLTGMGTLTLAGVMPLNDALSEPGEAVRQLAEELGIRHTRFKPLLPIGRAKELHPGLVPESPVAFATSMEIIERDFQPVYTCGLGQNLYVESNGQAFPCYAYHKPHAYLGNVITAGLDTIILGNRFNQLSRHTVDSNPKCRECSVRYLCGGACRAWGTEDAQYNLDAPPPNCHNLEKRAKQLYVAACEYLGIATGLYAFGDQGALFEKTAPRTPAKTFYKKFWEVSEPVFKRVPTHRR